MNFLADDQFGGVANRRGRLWRHDQLSSALRRSSHVERIDLERRAQNPQRKKASRGEDVQNGSMHMSAWGQEKWNEIFRNEIIQYPSDDDGRIARLQVVK